VGALVWREFLGTFDAASLEDAGGLFRGPFDPDNPVATPRDLIDPPTDPAQPDRIHQALGLAVLRLEQAGLSVDTPLGEAQFTKKAKDREGMDIERIPVHGGSGVEGITNIIVYSVLKTTVGDPMPRGEVINESTDLTTEGYVVNYGTSYIMAMEFTDDGPRASAFVTYGQSDDPLSPHHTDQTRLFSAKQWRPVLFTEDDIAADPNLRVEVVFGYDVSE
jgi:acyl-homoserine-lactone acylase